MAKRKSIKVIVIDPVAKTITEEKLVSELESWYELLNCRIIERVAYNSEHDVICDEEGLYHENNGLLYLHGSPFRGKVALAGVDFETGEWIDHALDLEDVRANTLFYMEVTT